MGILYRVFIYYGDYLKINYLVGGYPLWSIYDYLPKEYVQRKSLTQLVYKGLDNVKTINKMQYEQVLKSYPLVAICVLR